MNQQDQLVSDLISAFGKNVSSTDIRAYCAQNDLDYRSVVSQLKKCNPSVTTFNLQMTLSEDVDSIENSFSAPSAEETKQVTNIFSETLIPKKDPNYVAFGPFRDLKKIVASRIFFPVFITGLSGNGKTVSVEQVCAQLKRELIRVNITCETDQDDLIGGFRLEGGRTVWHDGPVVEAMRRGAILLLDEVDLASNKIMVLQSVLEGKPLYLKKISKLVHPSSGFNIIATANTKGKGSGDGRFIGTNVMNEAFLERFAITMEQSYPTSIQETKILSKLAKSIGLTGVDDFIKRLVTWGEDTRKTFLDGGIDELISTRRLTLVIQGYKILGNKALAVKYAVARFDDEVKDAFINQYEKIDEDYYKQEKLAQLETRQDEDTETSEGNQQYPMLDPSINEIQVVPIPSLVSNPIYLGISSSLGSSTSITTTNSNIAAAYFTNKNNT